MWRPNIKNRTFDRMGEEWAPLIDPNHFLGRSALDIPYPKPDHAPAASLMHKGDLMILEIKAPDYQKEDFNIEIKNDLLFVQGNRETKTTASSAEYISKELHRDSFERLFKLAPSIAREGVKASFKDGVLQIKFRDIPKEEEQEATYRKVLID